MSNVLSEAKRQQVIALGRLGWPLRRIEQETGVRRETASAYLQLAGVGVRAPGAWGQLAPAKPANEVTTGSDADQVERTVNPSANPNPENLSTKGKAKAKRAKPANAVTTGFGEELEAENSKRSVCEPFREAIELGLSRGRDATAIWQDLVSESGVRRWLSDGQALRAQVARKAATAATRGDSDGTRRRVASGLRHGRHGP